MSVHVWERSDGMVYVVTSKDGLIVDVDRFFPGAGKSWDIYDIQQGGVRCA